MSSVKASRLLWQPQSHAVELEQELSPLSSVCVAFTSRHIATDGKRVWIALLFPCTYQKPSRAQLMWCAAGAVSGRPLQDIRRDGRRLRPRRRLCPRVPQVHAPGRLTVAVSTRGCQNLVQSPSIRPTGWNLWPWSMPYQNDDDGRCRQDACCNMLCTLVGCRSQNGPCAGPLPMSAKS